MSQVSHHASQAGAWLKRFWPLLVLVGAFAFVFAMGWQRHLTLEELANRRAELSALIAEYPALSLLAFIGLYTVIVALSLPGGAVMTIAGGFLFGWLWGGVAAIIAATIGAIVVFLVARSTLGDALAGRAAPWLERLRKGFQEGAFSYLLFLRLVPVFPFWLVNLGARLVGSEPLHLRARDPDRHHPRHFCLFHRRTGSRQLSGRSGGGASILPCQNGIEWPRIMSVRARP